MLKLFKLCGRLERYFQERMLITRMPRRHQFTVYSSMYLCVHICCALANGAISLTLHASATFDACPSCSTLANGTKTRDVGGSASTTQFLDAIVGTLEAEAHKNQAAKKGKGVSKSV